jgi:hypothetical protein
MSIDKLTFFICSATSVFTLHNFEPVPTNVTNASRTVSFPSHVLPANACSRAGQISSALAKLMSLPKNFQLQFLNERINL